MTQNPLDDVTTLTFDVFGTTLDLTGSLVPPISDFLIKKGVTSVSGADFWAQWRGRQRVEQYQDTLLMLGHSGYLQVCKRAFLYTLRSNAIDFTYDEVDEFMSVWQNLSPYQDSVPGLEKLALRFKLVALSNGEKWYLEHLVNNRIKHPFDAVISIDEAGVFKPHPAVYRTAARILGLEPQQIMMVAAHAFDIMGARACGYRGAYINRYELPYEETPYQPDIVVGDFLELASEIVDN